MVHPLHTEVAEIEQLIVKKCRSDAVRSHARVAGSHCVS